jgi:tetratricopeptide (TPR) repeat protein
MRTLTALLLMVLAAAPAHARTDAAWSALPLRVPADSVAMVFASWEGRGGPGVRPGEASYALGQFHYARGEYEPAAGAFLRAAARLAADDRAAARYGWALATFALGRATAARVAFDEVAQSRAGVRTLAALGSAQCWEAEGRPERALAGFLHLLANEPGEAAPPALERVAALAARARRERDAEAARRRVVREYPRSVEAARVQGAPVAAHRPAPATRLETGARPRKEPLP